MMIHGKIGRMLAAGLIASMLTACGGGGSPTLPAPPSKGGNGTLAITVKIPGANNTQSARGRRPDYTSRDSKGIGVEFVAHGGSLPGDALPALACGSTKCYGQALGFGAAGCPAVATSDGSFTCTVYVPNVPSGYDDLRVSLWNAYPTTCTGAGTVTAAGTNCTFSAAGDSVLSQWNSTVTQPNGYAIVSGISNALGFTLLPVVDSVAVSMTGSFVDGSSSSPAQTAALTFKDQAGDIILNAANPGETLIDASGNPLTIKLDLANDLGASGCSHFNTGTPCSLFFNQATQPSVNSDQATTPTYTINYDGSAQFPANNATADQIAISGNSTGADTIQVTINGHSLASAYTVPAAQNNGTTATALANAINADATDSAIVSASASGSTVVLNAVNNGAGSEYAVSAVATDTGGTTGAVAASPNMNFSFVPQVTIAASGGTIAGTLLPGTFNITRAGTGTPGNIPVPGTTTPNLVATGAATNPSGPGVDANGGVWVALSNAKQVELFVPVIGNAPSLGGADSAAGTGTFPATGNYIYRVVFKKGNVVATGATDNTAAYADVATNLSTESPPVNVAATTDNVVLAIGSAPATSTVMDIYRTAAAGASGSETLIASNVAVSTAYTDTGLANGSVALPAVATGAPSGTFVKAGPFSTGGDAANYLTRAGNGRMCYSSGTTHNIGCFNPAAPTASLTDYTFAGSNPYAMTLGPDGNVWFSDLSNTGNLGTVTSTGQIIEYAAAGLSGPNAIVTGPDGNIWCANGGNVVAFNPVTHAVVHTVAVSANAIGTDGTNLWAGGASTLYKITTGGSSTSYTLPGFVNFAYITAGSDGNIYASSYTQGKIAEFVPSTATELQLFQAIAGTNVQALANNPRDGRMYFADYSDNNLGYFTP